MAFSLAALRANSEVTLLKLTSLQTLRSAYRDPGEDETSPNVVRCQLKTNFSCWKVLGPSGYLSDEDNTVFFTD